MVRKGIITASRIAALFKLLYLIIDDKRNTRKGIKLVIVTLC